MPAQASAFKATGTTLGYELSGSTFTPVGQLVNLDMGGTTIGSIDTTTLLALAMTSIASIPDNGDVSFTVFLVMSDATIAQLQTWTQAPATVPWQIQLSDGSTSTTGSKILFSAYLTKYTPKGFKQGEAPTADVTIKITGPLNFTPGT